VSMVFSVNFAILAIVCLRPFQNILIWIQTEIYIKITLNANWNYIASKIMILGIGGDCRQFINAPAAKRPVFSLLSSQNHY
ncbi:MAG: hypothetical protein AB7S77_14455, partial [Desulfatirhabdiaceae bacterium]